MGVHTFEGFIQIYSNFIDYMYVCRGQLLCFHKGVFVWVGSDCSNWIFRSGKLFPFYSVGMGIQVQILVYLYQYICAFIREGLHF